MTQKELRDFLKLKRKSERLDSELCNRRISVKKLKNGEFYGRQLNAIDLLENEAKAARVEYLINHKKVYEFISGISDVYIRDVFSLRYLEGYTWVQVAITIGGGNSSDGVRKLAERYMRKVEANGK